MIKPPISHAKDQLCVLFAGNGQKKLALKNLEQICSIPVRSKLYPSYFHSFGMTENYIIFVEQAFKLDIFRLATAYIRGDTWGKCLLYDKDDVVSKVCFAFGSQTLTGKQALNCSLQYL